MSAELSSSNARESERPTVVVAMSGGVDSATAAALLVEAGHRVIGMTLRLYDARGTAASSGGRCCGPRDIEDARRVAAHLGIPYYVVDLAEEFSERVMDDFADAYLDGRTPNPCAKCNEYIKFSPLLSRARALGADVLATGHYARLEPGEGGRVQLRRGVDADKDQSYFLFAMPEHELDSVWFPLGGMRKEEVRARAEGFQLPVAGKAESQEICFVPDGDYAGFVEKRSLVRRGRLPLAGNIEDESGHKLGEHGGIHRFTIGQRRGLGFAGPGGAPLYVTRIDAERGAVVVGPKSHAERSQFTVRDVRWLGAPPAASSLRADVQVRHRGRQQSAEISLGAGGTAEVAIDAAQVIAPGQAAVFYQGDTVLGGGWIA